MKTLVIVLLVAVSVVAALVLEALLWIRRKLCPAERIY
jgi:hypothetical protein